MDKTSSPDASSAAQSRFWVGPLVVGSCFALGYGITDRVLTLQTNAVDPVPQALRRSPSGIPCRRSEQVSRRRSRTASGSHSVRGCWPQAGRPRQRSRQRPNPMLLCRPPTPRFGRPPTGLTRKPSFRLRSPSSSRPSPRQAHPRHQQPRSRSWTWI